MSGPINKTVVIFTTFSTETQAVTSRLSGLRAAPGNSGCLKGDFGDWDVIVCEMGPGNTSAAAITTKVCTQYEPMVALLVGVAGGVKDVKIGDVVVGTKVYAYESGKEVEREDAEKGPTVEFQPRPDLQKGTFSLIQRARVVEALDQWKQRLNPQLPHSSPRLFVRPLAAGEKVVATNKGSIAALIKQYYGDTLAVEMEGKGFLDGLFVDDRIGCVIRGVSDLLSGKSVADEAGSQERAADAAAAVAFEILAGYVSVIDEADLRALGQKLLDSSKPPSVSVLFTNPSSAAVDGLNMLSSIERQLTSRGGAAATSTLSALMKGNEKLHLVVGPPGSGKTHVLWNAAKRTLAQGEIIPLYLPAGQVGLFDELKAMISDTIPGLVFDDVIRDPRVCLFVDGWSEFPDGGRIAEKHKALRVVQNTRVLANGKVVDLTDTPFASWTLELLSLDQVAAILDRAQMAKPAQSVLDLLRLPLFLAIYLYSGGAATKTGELLRQMHAILSRSLPPDFSAALCEAVATSQVARDRSYGSLTSNLEAAASRRSISAPLDLLRRLGTITERNGQVLPLHDLYWDWLAGQGMMRASLATQAIEFLETRESMRLALEAGFRPEVGAIAATSKDDIVLAATLNSGSRSTDKTLKSVLAQMLSDPRLPVRQRGALAAIELGNGEHLKAALTIFSELCSAGIYLSDWDRALQSAKLYDHRGVLTDWLGATGTDQLLTAIAKRGSSEWVPWLEQMADAGKISWLDALSTALSCASDIPKWGRPHLDELLLNKAWTLRITADRRINVPLARYVASEYERFVSQINPGTSKWIDLNRILVGCGDEGVFNALLTKFDSMSPQAQEYLGYAITARGEPWIAAFQRVAFAHPPARQHHKLSEHVSTSIDDGTAREWIASGYFTEGWRVLLARHGAVVLPELIAQLPESLGGAHDIQALAVMRYLDSAPESLLADLRKRTTGTLYPKVAQDILNAMAKVYPVGMAAVVQLIGSNAVEMPAYHVGQGLHLYEEWRLKTGAQLMLKSDGVEHPVPFPNWIARRSALRKWEDAFTARMLAQVPETAIDLLLNLFRSDEQRGTAIVSALNNLNYYNQGLFDYMMERPALARMVPNVFALAFDGFPVEALQRCISSDAIDQDVLIFRLGTTRNPIHKQVHVELIARLLGVPINIHHARYIANMLRAYTTAETVELLENAASTVDDSWIWLVREVEAARGERLIDERGAFRAR